MRTKSAKTSQNSLRISHIKKFYRIHLMRYYALLICKLEQFFLRKYQPI